MIHIIYIELDREIKVVKSKDRVTIEKLEGWKS